VKRAIKTHSTDFVAILVLLVLAIVVAGYILNHEGLRFPFIQSSPVTYNAQFSTAQAVTPGQGQSVRISGVQVGTLGSVKLEDGLADVQMDILPQYTKLIHTNATALLRPKTGLDDMFVELNPGTSAAPRAKPGFTIPVSNTNPVVNLDEVLASLDADSRQYLDLLVNGAGVGLKNRGGELAQVLERFEPTHQDLARVSEAVARRGADLRQLVNSLQRLNTALASKQNQLVELVNSSSHVFHAFASEDGNISRAVADLPGTLQQTTETLGKVEAFAKELGPAAHNLLPAAAELPAANAALAALARPSAPIVQNQIRPFVVAARPLVRNLRPASLKLASATPNLTKVFGVLNNFVNMVGYNPGTTEHGYLWWLAWLDHNARTLFSIQDANGDYRPLFLQASCSTLVQIANSIPGSESLLNLTPLLTNAGICPKQAAADASDYKKYEQNLGVRRADAVAGGQSAGSVKAPGFQPKLPVH
jgi:phospholipid/cholesterol/gamma-HCH transport system substrate-binding protein